MANATKATVSATPSETPFTPGAAAFAHWAFDFTDAAGTKAATQSADGVTGLSAVFDISAAAAGAATFTISAVDTTGAVMGTPDVVNATLPVALTFPVPTAGAVAFS